MAENLIQKKRKSFDKIITWFAFLSLVVSFLYAITAIIFSAFNITFLHLYERPVRSYLLLLIQCIIGFLMFFLPDILVRRFKMSIATELHIIFILFLYGAIILGETQNFYNTVKNWDTLMHTTSGVMLGAFSYAFIDILNDSKRLRSAMSPLFVAVFSFCFALSIECIWEIYEFAADTVFNFNMQHYMSPDGELFYGRMALYDTMKDLCFDTAGSFVMAVFGYNIMKRKKNKLPKEAEKK